MSETRLQKIERLRELLQSGVTSVTVDGVTTSFDLTSARRELRELERQEGLRTRRRRIIGVRMDQR